MHLSVSHQHPEGATERRNGDAKGARQQRGSPLLAVSHKVQHSLVHLSDIVLIRHASTHVYS
jgi:hypothetical protein